MNKKNYKKLVKAIQEAVPEIMELKFGCWFIFDEIKFLYGTDKNKEEELKEVERGEIKIIGRDITLEDVLVALKNCGDITLQTDNWNCSIDNVRFITDENNYGYWELSKPLHLQLDEVKEFLYNLIK